MIWHISLSPIKFSEKKGPLVKFRFSKKAKKCGAIFLKVLDITKQLPNLEDDCSKFLWPSLNISTLPPLTFCSTKIRSDLWTLHSHRILQNIWGLTIIGLPADSFQRISNLASLFLSFFSAEQWKFLEKMVLVFNVKKYLQQKK